MNDTEMLPRSTTSLWSCRRQSCAPRALNAHHFAPRSLRRPSSTVVEHHPWDAFVSPVDHVIDARSGCLAHGVACPAQATIAAAVRLGYDPFS